MSRPKFWDVIGDLELVAFLVGMQGSYQIFLLSVPLEEEEQGAISQALLATSDQVLFGVEQRQVRATG